jgi:hypothetical protein
MGSPGDRSWLEGMPREPNQNQPGSNGCDGRRSRRQSRGRSAVGARTPAGNSPVHRMPHDAGLPSGKCAHRKACPARPIKPRRTWLLAPTTPPNPLWRNRRRPAYRRWGRGAEPWPSSGEMLRVGGLRYSGTNEGGARRVGTGRELWNNWGATLCGHSRLNSRGPTDETHPHAPCRPNACAAGVEQLRCTGRSLLTCRVSGVVTVTFQEKEFWLSGGMETVATRRAPVPNSRQNG